MIRAKCYPLRIDNIDNKQIEMWISRLQEVDLLFIYQVDGKSYLQLKTWDKHQQVRAKKSKFPASDINCNQMISSDINCNQMQANVPVIQSNPNPILFDHFWKVYPRKAAKAQAEKAWTKLNPDPSLYDLIMQKLAIAKQTAKWKEKNGEFVPYPATWLNGRRWEDELPNCQSDQPQLTDYTGLAAKERAECEQIRANRGN